MKINKKNIKKLDPCYDRFQNFVDNYGNKDFYVDQFLRLKKITHQDKLWVAFRMMPKKNIRFVAAEIAMSVLHIYEEKYPGDDRPRKAIEEASKKRLNKNAAAHAASAAHDAYNAASDAASAAASDAASAAAYAAASDAAYAAASDAAHDAYNAASAAAYNAASDAASAAAKQEKLQLKIIAKYWK